jgi:flagellar protein FliS
MSTNQSQQYQTQQIMTASPAMLVFLLFDKAINSLKEAIRAIEAGEIEARWKANGRAMEIVEHLRMTLNMDAGGETAKNLDSIYGAILLELPKVDLKNNPEPARQVISILEPLRESWRVLAEKGEETTRQAAEAAAQLSQAAKVKQASSPPPTAPRPAPPQGAMQQGPGAPASIKISA